MTAKGSSDRVDDQSGERTEDLEENIEERAQDRVAESDQERLEEPTGLPAGESFGERSEVDEDDTREVEGLLSEAEVTEEAREETEAPEETEGFEKTEALEEEVWEGLEQQAPSAEDPEEPSPEDWDPEESAPEATGLEQPASQELGLEELGLEEPDLEAPEQGEDAELTDEDRARLPEVLNELSKWRTQAKRVSGGKERATTESDRAAEAILSRVVEINGPDDVSWQVLPLRVSDPPRLGVMYQETTWPKLGPKVTAWLNAIEKDLPDELRKVKRTQGFWGRFTSKAGRRKSDEAAKKLLNFYDTSAAAGLPEILSRLESHAETARAQPITDLLAPHVGFAARTPDWGEGSIVEIKEVEGFPETTKTVLEAAYWEPQAKRQATLAGNALKRDEVKRSLKQMPVDRLATVARGRISVAPLKRAGLSTVQDVLDRPLTLTTVPGIGETMGPRVNAAARALQSAAEDETPVRIRSEDPTPEMLGAVVHMHRWDALRQVGEEENLVALAKALRPLVSSQQPGDTHYAVFGGKDALLQAVQSVEEFAQSIPSPAEERAAAWADFVEDPARYHLMLEELGVVQSHEDMVLGEMPDTIKIAIQDSRVNTGLLNANLRGYQDFAARFALVQKKTLIGDESGLGKTVVALAVLAHLQAESDGETPNRFLVICPPNDVGRWVSEVRDKSDLPAHTLVGTTRKEAFEKWQKEGGVGVTTYGTLPSLEPLLEDTPIECVVIDEATYIKNPNTKRAHLVRTLIESSDTAILLTGEPFDDSLRDLGVLVSYLQPDLRLTEVDLLPGHLHRQVAPAYLRRTREDVFAELPEVVVMDEQLPLTPVDQAAYRHQVARGNVHDMRAVASGLDDRSTKVQRVLQLARDAQANGRKMIVVSSFPDVLETLSETLDSTGPGVSFGPLTRHVPKEESEQISAAFAEAGPGATLLVEVGGGPENLGFEDASTLVIMEPQLDEGAEWSQVSRAVAPGNLRSIHVHRLISEDTVEERLIEARVTPPADEGLAAEETVNEETPSDVSAIDAPSSDVFASGVQGTDAPSRDSTAADEAPGDALSDDLASFAPALPADFAAVKALAEGKSLDRAQVERLSQRVVEEERSRLSMNEPGKKPESA